MEVMRATIIRSLLGILLIGCIFAGGRWLWTTPLAPIPSKAAIGSLNLGLEGAEVVIGFIPPKNLSSITVVFPSTIQNVGHFSSQPDFKMTLRVRVSETNGTNIIGKSVTHERMQWTNWHPEPSLLLMLNGWLGDRLSSGREYTLTISVVLANADLGEAQVFLHWMDGGYVWGREKQELRFTKRVKRLEE